MPPVDVDNLFPTCQLLILFLCATLNSLLNMDDIPLPGTIESDAKLEQRRMKILLGMPTSAVIPGENGLVICLACRAILKLKTKIKNGIERGYFAQAFHQHLRRPKHLKNEAIWIANGRPLEYPAASDLGEEDEDPQNADESSAY
ncbi:hypothetical protein EST38_g10479 [Candolleomyces aberdarensis]|uniref:Uncharacterized protein n=1 Tax=Candolleomyces aberdarensis TaxID=2316362 RepID=A0A4Q2DAK2_9AGAR|nr:hypothetical protein EST38_g10479 [Candolleomyces aberdarensis]